MTAMDKEGFMAAMRPHMEYLASHGNRGRRASFRDEDLRGLNLVTMSILKFRDLELSGAILSGANLHRLDLSGSVLEGTALDGACLDGAVLDGCRMAGASLRGARMDEASLRGAVLDGAILDGACLDRACLAGASLVKASLADVLALRSDLEGASLRQAVLRNGDFRYARFRNADLTEADLAFSDVSYAIGLDKTKLKGIQGIPSCRGFDFSILRERHGDGSHEGRTDGGTPSQYKVGDQGRREREKRTMRIKVRAKNMEEYCKKNMFGAYAIAKGSGVGVLTVYSFIKGKPSMPDPARRILEFLGMTPAEAIGKGLLERVE
jgi:2-iminobutanoate/2-iminopropanoate deaminase